MTSATLTRWYALREHAEQRRLWTSLARFKVAACGRRSGKTEISKRFAVKSAMAPHDVSDYHVLLGSPTWQQSRRVFWRDIKALCPTWALKGQDRRRAISESEMTIDFANGAQIVVTGLDRPQRAEGTPVDLAIIDESADVKEEAFTEHIRPGLSERGGQAWLVGTPDGRKWFWQAAQKAQEDASGLWSFHTWPSSTVLDPAEIEIARAELDQRTFEQEYCASFLDATGRVYYAFRRELHAACLLYTSDAADDLLCVDLGGRRIIKKKKMTGSMYLIPLLRCVPSYLCTSQCHSLHITHTYTLHTSTE